MGKVLRIRVFVVVILAAAVAAAVATILNHKQQLELLDAAGRREYLGNKLGGRIPDEQLDRLAAAISEKLDAGKPAEPVAEVAEEAAAAEEAAEETNPEG
ncbi:MAG: hypothetical protein QNJ89_14815 [Acidimicrobiia bacterium]|nr:hypothetical protein [Acidimicrobiia bacterium]